MGRISKEIDQLLVFVLFSVFKRRLLVDIDSFVCRVARSKDNLENLQVTRDADQVHRVLLLGVLRLHIGVVLHEEVHHLAIVGEDGVVQRT